MSEKEINNLIARKISYLLSINEKSQQDLADYMGVSQATISNWCKGVKMPRMDKIDKICTFFNCNRSDLMEDKPPLNVKDTKEISKILEDTELLLMQEGLMFDGEPASPESINSIISAMKIGMEMAKQNNKKYTPNKFKQKRDD